MSSYIKKRLDTIKTHLQNKQYDDVIIRELNYSKITLNK